MGNNHRYETDRASVENCIKMEDSLSKLLSSQRGNEGINASEKSIPDDLTNLNWVAGIPVPMNTSVSPPDNSRAKKLFYGSLSTNNPLGHQQTEVNSPTTPTLPVPARTKSLKTPLPTYKIVVKDQAPELLCHTFSSSNLSLEKRDSVILANVVSSDNGCHGVGSDRPVLDSDEDYMGIGKESGVVGDEAAEEEENLHHKKPICSYTCLIGMALKASNGCLPVNAIYQYIEREFPYFITAPDGWKNSVRHNLSLNPIFRKVNREGWTGKKGYLWEVCPDKQDLVDKEILRFLHITGKKLGEFTAPVKASSKYKQRMKKVSHPHPPLPSTTPIFCSRCTRIISPTPHDSSTSSDDSSTHMATAEEIKRYSADIQEEVASSDIRIKPKATITQPAFDTDKSPSKYIGIKSPPGDPNEVAKEVFGLCSSPENPTSFYSPFNYSGPFIPLYAQPNQFGIPYENLDPLMSNSSSSSSNASPMGSMAASLLSHYHQYAMPLPFHYFLGNQYPQAYSQHLSATESPNNKDTAQKLMPTTTPSVSIKVLTSSDQVENAEICHELDESQDSCQSHDIKRGRHQNSSSFSWHYPDVAGLTSPLKRMKVMDDSMLLEKAADESISAYFADVSANSTCSDDDNDENEEVSSIMSLLMKTNQQRLNMETGLPLAELSRISNEEKVTLEQLTGTSDLGTLLNNGLQSLAVQGKTRLNQDSDNTLLSPDSCTEVSKDDCTYNDGITAMDMHDIDSKVTSSQEDIYYLPSLDSLLNIGEDTLVTIKAAMNLDIQGVVEIATEESSCKDVESNIVVNSISADGIQIN